MTAEAPAETVTVSYPADLSDWGRDIVEGRPFRAYLRKAHDTARPGDTWAEFVGVGCCGDSLDVPLRVESVAGGFRIDDHTTVEFTVRDACGLQGGWRVQSAAGPTSDRE
jgi:hypothetical protein